MSKPDTLHALPDLLALRNTLHRAGIPLRAQDEAKDDLRKLVLMVDLFCASIETGVFPTHASPLHRMARKLVETSGMKPRRRRRKFSDGKQPCYSRKPQAPKN